jgi:hypothetical protein
MSDKAYQLRFKHPELSIQPVIAASAEIHGEHIALLNSKGKLAALFLTEVVESWSEFAPLSGSAPGKLEVTSLTRSNSQKER